MRRWRRKFWVVAVLLVCLVAGWALRRGPEDTLFARATEYALPSGYTDYLWRYGWLDSSRIIVFGRDDKGRIGIYSISLADKKPAPLSPLNTLVTTRLRRKDSLDWPLISPDGQWLLWYDAVIGAPGWLVARVDGSRCFFVPFTVNRTRGGRSAIWLSDSKSWVEHYYADTGKFEVIQDVTRIHDITGKASPYRRGLKNDEGFAVSTLSGGRLLYVDFAMGNGDTSEAHASVVDPVRPEVALEKFNVALPTGWYLWEYRFSPQADRILWKLREKRADDGNEPDSSLVDRMKEWFGAGPRIRYRLCISRKDGSGLRDIGELNVKRDDEGFYSVQWSPDGKRIAFLRRGKLYTVDAD